MSILFLTVLSPLQFHVKSIFDKLTNVDVHEMIPLVDHFLHVPFPVHEIRKIDTSSDLFYVLMDAGLISASNRKSLARLLRYVDREDLSYRLLTFEGESNVLPQKDVVFKLVSIRQVIMGHFRVAVKPHYESESNIKDLHTKISFVYI